MQFLLMLIFSGVFAGIFYVMNHFFGLDNLLAKVLFIALFLYAMIRIKFFISARQK